MRIFISWKTFIALNFKCCHISSIQGIREKEQEKQAAKHVQDDKDYNNNNNNKCRGTRKTRRRIEEVKKKKKNKNKKNKCKSKRGTALSSDHVARLVFHQTFLLHKPLMWNYK